MFSDIKYRQNIAKKSRNLSKQSNVLPVFNITEQTALVQSVAGDLYTRPALYLSTTLISALPTVFQERSFVKDLNLVLFTVLYSHKYVKMGSNSL